MIKCNNIQEIKGSEVLDHLGLVAATIKKLGIAEEIDKLLPLTKSAKTTMGQRASAMILNGLGFIDDRLYMFPKFLENKPVARLFAENLVAADFNDDALGRFLDAIHEYGETKLYSTIALKIALKENLLHKSVHFDTTSLSVYGEYENDDCAVETSKDQKVIKNHSNNHDSRDLELSKNAKPEYGYAKNKRFDLKQMTLLMATTGAAGFPVWCESHNGNASDKKTLEEAAQRMQKFCKVLKDAPELLYVGDSAMYSSCVKNGNNLLWISKVPENIKLSKNLLYLQDISWQTLPNEYKIYATEQEYNNVLQRWILVYSQQAYDREIITLEKNIQQEYEKIDKNLWHLGNDDFGCAKDIDTQIKKLTKTLKYHKISYKIEEIAQYLTAGRPKKHEIPQKIVYKLNASLACDEEKIKNCKLTKGRFILATNQLDKNILPNEEILPIYKEQSGTESGFKFIKDNAFEIDSIFLKKSGRISALMMIMTLCLMVYSYAQHFLRKQLLLNNDFVLSQSNKLTSKPSMKWIYRLFHGVHVLKLKINNEISGLVLNLNDLLRKIIVYFGDFACKIYEVDNTFCDAVCK